MTDGGIRDFFRGKSIFITGGSGFMGKVLIEKFLYACDLKEIFLLMRPKRGKSGEQRVKEFSQIPVSNPSPINYLRSVIKRVFSLRSFIASKTSPNCLRKLCPCMATS
jgi:hypothetical protein